MGLVDREHLPECESYRDECGGGCICHHVRALEARLEDERQSIVLRYLISDREQQEAEQRAFAAGVQAARDAASKQRSKFKARDWDDAIDAALAAIDALRNPPSLPPTTGRAHKY